MNSVAAPVKSTFQKGDRVYIVHVCHGQGGGWEPTSEQFRTSIYAELVELTSFGKKQGTAVTVKGNLEVRVYSEHATPVEDRNPAYRHTQFIVRTAEEVDSIAAREGDLCAAESIDRARKQNNDWHRDYTLTGKGTPLGVERNQRAAKALETCVALPAIIVYK